MLDPPRISPLEARLRSCSAAASPLPRSTKVKHFDLDTYTLMSASGDSRLYCSHHLFSGSVTASVPIFLSHVGISGSGASAAKAVAIPDTPAAARDMRTTSFVLETI